MLFNIFYDLKFVYDTLFLYFCAMKLIEKFKSSQDFIDICYMIDHISDIEVRISVLEQLGYKIGTLVVNDYLGSKRVFVDKRKMIRMQITSKFKNINLAKCVIIEPKKIYFQTS